MLTSLIWLSRSLCFQESKQNKKPKQMFLQLFCFALAQLKMALFFCFALWHSFAFDFCDAMRPALPTLLINNLWRYSVRQCAAAAAAASGVVNCFVLQCCHFLLKGMLQAMCVCVCEYAQHTIHTQLIWLMLRYITY